MCQFPLISHGKVFNGGAQLLVRTFSRAQTSWWSHRKHERGGIISPLWQEEWEDEEREGRRAN